MNTGNKNNTSSFISVILGVSIIVYLLLVFITFIISEHIESKRLNTQHLESLRISMAHMESEIESIFKLARLFGTDDRIARLTENPDDRQMRLDVNQFLIRIKITSYLVVTVMDKNGTILATGDWDNPVSFMADPAAVMPYLDLIMGGDIFQLILPAKNSGNQFSHTVLMPIHGDTKIVGVAVIQTNPQNFIYSDLPADKILLVTDFEGTVVISSESDYIGKSLNDIDGTKYNTALLDMDAMNLTAYMAWSKNETKSSVYIHILVVSLLWGMIVLFILFISERWQHMKTINESAIRDPLTNVYTRLYMKEAIPPLLSSHDRRKILNFGAILFDLDFFKNINDQYGHAAGDYVLKRVSSVLLSEIRKSDIPIRYGGEEFLILVPSEKRTDVIGLAERIRLKISNLEITYKHQLLSITISGGVSERLPNEQIESLIDRADTFLYKAKERGRNQICFGD